MNESIRRRNEQVERNRDDEEIDKRSKDIEDQINKEKQFDDRK